MEGRELQHFFHKHPLILKIEQSKTNGSNDQPEEEIYCIGCRIPISGPFYGCEKCGYYLHKVCAELPRTLDHIDHPEHSLRLFKPYSNFYRCDSCANVEPMFAYHCSICKFSLDVICASAILKIKDKCHRHPLTPLQIPIEFICHICRKKEVGLSYKCYSCSFWVHQTCILQADTVEHSHYEDPYPFLELQHFSHNHPLILIAHERKTENDYLNRTFECYGCRTQILGPFYSCGKCRYFLHKVCAELPISLDHPLHSEHSLTLHMHGSSFGYLYENTCKFCRKRGGGFFYRCSICSFDVDMKCASSTHMIQDKCHPHSLTPIQVSVRFSCHICLKKKKGLSYKCNICPFWVHQNCTLLPSTTKHSSHDHILKLFPSIPFKFSDVSDDCDICHSNLFMFQCIYGCDRCLFFAHVSCARSETIQVPSTSRDQNIDGQNLIFLPMKQDLTELISRFVRNYIDGEANIENTTIQFDHEHPLSLINEKTNEKTCDACAISILGPSYGCVDCGYFLHKYCASLPKQIHHQSHPEHQLVLRTRLDQIIFIRCTCCRQWCNSFFYECSECRDCKMDIKCASLEGAVVYHEGHRHPLTPIVKPHSTCSACGYKVFADFILQCNKCSFILCYKCAMAPRVIKHRYGKSEPFKLTYSAPENHFNEYICEICLYKLNPKRWFYHCVFADQFAHIQCMLLYGADSNIKYGKSYMIGESHEHEVTTISCTYDCSPCSFCRHPLRTGLAGAGLECKTCNFRIHLRCPGREIIKLFGPFEKEKQSFLLL